MPWKKCQSTSKPGRYYYFHTETKESRWSPPPGLAEEHCKVSDGGRGGSVEEAMEVERWAEDAEVCMDVDMTSEEEEFLMSEITQTRNNLTVAPHTQFIPQDHMMVTSQYTERLYLVLDTNVLISHLHFLVELKDYAIKSVGRPVLIVPWIVMQELDALKSRSTKVATKVKQAITFLNDCFASRHPRVRGQTMEEVQTELTNIAIDNNDDRILHCCLLYQHKVASSGGLVVLFSNDTQLCSKAMVNQVHALNRKTLLSELRVLCRHLQQQQFCTTTPHQQSCARHAPTAEFNSTMKQQAARKLLLDDLLCESEATLRECLSIVVSREMELAYQDLWMTVVVIKPPWTFRDLVHILDKHWIAVFGLLMDRSYHGIVKKFTEHVQSRHSKVPDATALENFVSSSVFFLNCFPKRAEYVEVVQHSVTVLREILRKLKEPGSVVQPSPAHPDPVPCTPTRSPSTCVGPSLLPLVTLTVEQIGELTSSHPDLPEHQLPWLLNILLETTKHCLSRLAGSLVASNSAQLRNENTTVISHLSALLETFLASIQMVLERQGDVTAARQFRAAMESFMLTCLQLSCPLSLEALCQLLPQQLQLMLQAQGEFSSSLDTLRLLAQQQSL